MALGLPWPIPVAPSEPEELDFDRGNVVQLSLFVELANEQAGSPHRPHRVRTRGSDTDLEKVENANGHDVAHKPIGRSLPTA